MNEPINLPSISMTHGVWQKICDEGDVWEMPWSMTINGQVFQHFIYAHAGMTHSEIIDAAARAVSGMASILCHLTNLAEAFEDGETLPR